MLPCLLFTALSRLLFVAWPARRRKGLFTVTLLLACGTTSPAATFWADGSASGCGASSSTYDPITRSCGSGSAIMRSTIQAAINLATTPGDIVEIRGGNYDEALNTAAAGSSLVFIRLRAYNSEQVIVNRLVQTSATHHYNWIEGLITDGPYLGGNNEPLRWRSDFSVITNCWWIAEKGDFSHALGSGQTCVNLTGNSNTFAGNLWYPGTNYVGNHTGTTGMTNFVSTNLTMIANSLVGWSIIYWDNDGGSTKAHALITSNSVTEIWHEPLTGGSSAVWTNGAAMTAGAFFEIGLSITGIGTTPAVGGVGNTFRGNTFTNFADVERIVNIGNSPGTRFLENLIIGTKASFAVNGNHVDIFQSLNSDGTGTNITCLNWLVEKNRFLDNNCQGGNMEMNWPDSGNWTVRGNVWDGLSSQWSPKVERSRYYNNTFLNIDGGYPFGFWPDAASAVWNNVFIGLLSTDTNLCRAILPGGSCSATAPENSPGWDVNNNFYCAGHTSWLSWPLSYLTNCTSTTNLCDSAPVTGVDPLLADILNVSPVARSYVPLAGSPLVNAGKNLSAEWPGGTDLNGVAFGQGGWDIGAFELPGTPSPSPSWTGRAILLLR